MKATFWFQLLCEGCGKAMELIRDKKRAYCVMCKTPGCPHHGRAYDLPTVELVEVQKKITHPVKP